MGYRGWSRLRSLALAGWLLPLAGVPAAAQQPGSGGQKPGGVIGRPIPTPGATGATGAPGATGAMPAPAAATAGGAQGRAVSLEEALRLAESTSEQVTISRAGV